MDKGKDSKNLNNTGKTKSKQTGTKMVNRYLKKPTTKIPNNNGQLGQSNNKIINPHKLQTKNINNTQAIPNTNNSPHQNVNNKQNNLKSKVEAKTSIKTRKVEEDDNQKKDIDENKAKKMEINKIEKSLNSIEIEKEKEVKLLKDKIKDFEKKSKEDKNKYNKLGEDINFLKEKLKIENKKILNYNPISI